MFSLDFQELPSALTCEEKLAILTEVRCSSCVLDVMTSRGLCGREERSLTLTERQRFIRKAGDYGHPDMIHLIRMDVAKMAERNEKLSASKALLAAR